MAGRQYTGAYVLSLFCDRHPKTEVFTGRTFQSCSNAAKRAGWKLHQETKTATCRSCNYEVRRSKTGKAFTVEIKRRRK
jgi:hypothetical protein